MLLETRRLRLRPFRPDDVAAFEGFARAEAYRRYLGDDDVGDEVMLALHLRPGSVFDPDAFAAFLAAQLDFSPKWMPRFVRVKADATKHRSRPRNSSPGCAPRRLTTTWVRWARDAIVKGADTARQFSHRC